MLLLILGLVLFLGIHLLPTSPDLRSGLIARFGEKAFKIAFSLISLAGFALIIVGYHKLQINPGKNEQIWDPPTWTRHITMLLMLFAMIFLVASKIPSRIRAKLKHPMLVSIKTWALAHLISNGDLGSIVLFGSFLAYAVYDRISVKRRGSGPRASDLTASPMNDVIVVVVGIALYALFVVWAHGALIGVPLISTSFAP